MQYKQTEREIRTTAFHEIITVHYQDIYKEIRDIEHFLREYYDSAKDEHRKKKIHEYIDCIRMHMRSIDVACEKLRSDRAEPTGVQEEEEA